MQKWSLLILLGLLSVLIESSLLAWPFVVVFAYLIAEVDSKFEIFLLMVLGVVLDILMVRTVGISSLALLVFFGILIYLRKSFSGNLRIEGLWLLVSALVWNMYLGMGKGYFVLSVGVVALIFFSRQLVSREIKLR